MRFYRLAFIQAVFLLCFLSCKKDETSISRSEEVAVDQLVKDSVCYYYQLHSLWSDEEAGKEHVSTDQYGSAWDVLEVLKRQTPFYPGYDGGIDRFSYLEDLSAGESLPPSYGFFATIANTQGDVSYPVIYFVEGGSPAEQAGISRSDIIIGLNEHQDLKVTDEKSRQAVIGYLLTALQQSSMQIRLRHRDNRESTVRLVSSNYTINPVTKDSVFHYPEKTIGYLALSSFEDAPEGHLNRQLLDQVFMKFEHEQISDLVVDLRYNTGGAVKTAEYMANRLVHGAADGALMYRYELNSYLSQRPFPAGVSFDEVHFRRNNSLSLGTVYFLVTDMTASASELLINVLRPYMPVVIIAEHTGTFGKPVGFFRQTIMAKVALWTASFKLVNARGETDYWDGIGADHQYVTDDIFRDFGDVEESMLSTAINLSLGKHRQVLPPKMSRAGHVNTVRQRNLYIK